jgi:CheY-like chemotaxis protein
VDAFLALETSFFLFSNTVYRNRVKSIQYLPAVSWSLILSVPKCSFSCRALPSEPAARSQIPVAPVSNGVMVLWSNRIMARQSRTISASGRRGEQEGLSKMTPIRRRAISHQNKPVPKRRRSPALKPNALAGRSATTVLVVDDDPSVRSSLARLIQAAGFRVLTFDRPSALLASAIPRANACMVVDINLPEMNGGELCSALTASGRGLPSVLITGRNDLATQRIIEEARAVAALFKPIDERTLFDAITQALALSRTESRE